MVEPSSQSNSTTMHIVSEMNLDENIATNPIRSCEHRDALSVFVHQQDIALCTECFFPKY